MKIFKAKINGRKVSRKFLRVIAFYRANSLFSKNDNALSLSSLQEFDAYESTGKLPSGVENFTQFSKTNGYANGKWIARVNQDMIFEDIVPAKNKTDMLFCVPASISKFELCNTGRFSWWWLTIFGSSYKVNKNQSLLG